MSEWVYAFETVPGHLKVGSSRSNPKSRVSNAQGYFSKDICPRFIEIEGDCRDAERKAHSVMEHFLGRSVRRELFKLKDGISAEEACDFLESWLHGAFHSLEVEGVDGRRLNAAYIMENIATLDFTGDPASIERECRDHYSEWPGRRPFALVDYWEDCEAPAMRFTYAGLRLLDKLPETIKRRKGWHHYRKCLRSNLRACREWAARDIAEGHDTIMKKLADGRRYDEIGSYLCGYRTRSGHLPVKKRQVEWLFDPVRGAIALPDSRAYRFVVWLAGRMAIEDGRSRRVFQDAAKRAVKSSVVQACLKRGGYVG